MDAPPHPRPTPPLTGDEGAVAWTAAQVATCVAAGEVSAREVLEAHLERIATLDQRLNALVLVDTAAARAQADAVDAAVRRGEGPGPLTGVPVVVKDNVDVAGQVTACGSAAHHGAIAVHDAPVVTWLRQAGAVLLGRSNMDELALGAATSTSAYGATSNPWSPRHSPGGSSGGSAAAVAAGLAPLALGTDTGGSVREPASQCGVVGMAPSPDQVPLVGIAPFAPGFDRVGPLARTPGDAALLLSVLAAGPVPQPCPAPVLSGLRVGLVTELTTEPNEPAIRERLATAAQVFRAAGAEVVPVHVPDAREGLGAYMAITSAISAPLLAEWVRDGRAGPEVARRMEYGMELRQHPQGQLGHAYAVQQRLADRMSAALEHADLLLSPTMPTTAPELAQLQPEALAELADPMGQPYTDCWTVLANLAGLPAVSVPAGTADDDGLPVGMMLTGAAGSDRLLLDAADGFVRALAGFPSAAVAAEP